MYRKRGYTYTDPKNKASLPILSIPVKFDVLQSKYMHGFCASCESSYRSRVGERICGHAK